MDKSEMEKKELDKHIDEFFENPINRLIFARLGQIDGDNGGKIDWNWVKNGDKKRNDSSIGV